ncbi:MAG TPA: DUF559 domain-containing protein [Balneolaceae bacterium]|nr:DUF559 domain-containing protein [Balneolaceae bacterium]
MTRKFISYNPKLVPLARKLRNNSTLAEVLLWQQIKGKKLVYDFDRQKPIDNYIVDFFCRQLMLVIEIDGCSHDYKSEYDINRQRNLEGKGITVVRFDDLDVKRRMDAVLRDLRWYIRLLEKQ